MHMILNYLPSDTAIDFSFIIGTLLVFAVYIGQARVIGLANASRTALTYFAVLWWLAFPVDALLLYKGLIDTQQIISISDTSIVQSVWIAILSFVIVVYAGIQNKKKKDHWVIEPRIESPISDKRIKSTIVASIIFACVFLYVAVFHDGKFTPFIQNSQNEMRVGNGHLFFLSELYLYILVIASPALAILISRSEAKLQLLLIFGVGIVFSCLMGMVLTSRKVMMLPLFAFILSWLWINWKSNAIWGLLLMFLFLMGAPALQTVRYALSSVNHTSVNHTSVNHTSVNHTNSSDLLIQQKDRNKGLFDVPKNSIGPHCIEREGKATPQTHIKIDRKIGNNQISLVDASGFIKHICYSDNAYGTYYFLQVIGSSFGLADHVAMYIERADLRSSLLGIDSGIAWLYNVILFAIPRVLWTDKPLQYGSVAEQKWLYPEMYFDRNVTMTLPPSYIVDFLYGFGIASLILLSFTMGMLIKYIDRSLLIGMTQGNYFWFAFGIASVCFMFNFIRSGTGAIQSLMQIFLGGWLVYGLPKRR